MERGILVDHHPVLTQKLQERKEREEEEKRLEEERIRLEKEREAFEAQKAKEEAAAEKARQRQKEKEEAARAKEARLQQAMLTIKKRYGKNAILHGTSYEEGATGRNRNRQIGGHKA